jgi:hypothetical protein
VVHEMTGAFSGVEFDGVKAHRGAFISDVSRCAKRTRLPLWSRLSLPPFQSSEGEP